MNIILKEVRFAIVIAGLLLSFVFPGSVVAQGSNATLSGTVTDPSGKGVARAKVDVRNLATLETADTETDSAGRYSVPNLVAGNYQISVAAEGYSTNVVKFAMAAGANKTVDVALGGALSLGDLGFTQAQTAGNAQEQRRLDRRSHMLQIHQRLGLITTVPLLATVITGGLAGGRSTSSTDRDLHAALGSTTAALYFTTAYYAIFAPKIPGTKTEGPIRLHKILAWIHGPGMVLTPILGAMAFDQKSQGEKVHGIAQIHGEVAVITAGAYGAAILSVSLRSGTVKHSAQHIATALHLERPTYEDSLDSDGVDTSR